MAFRDIQQLGAGKYMANLRVRFQHPAGSSSSEVALKPIDITGVTWTVAPRPSMGPNGLEVSTCTSAQLLPFTQMRRYTNPGSFTWTVPPEVNQIIVEAWGGGGGAGGAGAASMSNSSNAQHGVEGGATSFSGHGVNIIARGGDRGRGSIYNGSWSEFGYPGNGGGTTGVPNACTGCLSQRIINGQGGAQGAFNYISDSYEEGGSGGGSPNGGLGGFHNRGGTPPGGGGGGGTRSNEGGGVNHDGGDGANGAVYISY